MVATPEQRRRVLALIERPGSSASKVADTLGLDPATLARVVGGLRVNRGSLLVLDQALAQQEGAT